MTLVTVQEQAEILRCCPKSLYRWVKSRQIPASHYRRHGRNIKFVKELMEEWSGPEIKPKPKASISRFESARKRLLARRSLKSESTAPGA